MRPQLGRWLGQLEETPTATGRFRPSVRGGAAIAIGDEEMARAARKLVAGDGITVELSAAPAAAGWLRLSEEGRIAEDDVTVLVLTAADRRADQPVTSLT